MTWANLINGYLEKISARDISRLSSCSVSTVTRWSIGHSEPGPHVKQNILAILEKETTKFHQNYDPIDWDDPFIKAQVAEHDKEMEELFANSTVIYSSPGI